MTSLDSYAKPSVAVDLAIMTVQDGALKILLLERSATVPDDGTSGWAMPGGFVHIGEPLEGTVSRVLQGKVGRADIHFEQLATYGAVDRDPRGRVISIVYLALCPAHLVQDAELAEVHLAPEGHARTARAVAADGPLDLAFDHAQILADVVHRLRGKLDYTGIAYAFLPPKFTLRDVQQVHEAILGKTLNKPPFRRKVLDRGMIVPTGEFETGGAYRPAELYTTKPEE